MERFLSWADLFGSRFLPDFPHRGWLVLALFASVSIGILTSLFFVLAGLFRRPTSGETLGSAEEAVRRGDFAEARRRFAAAGAHLQAAKMSLRLGEKGEAAVSALQGGDPLLAAQLFASLGRAEEAAAAYEKGRKYSEAGEQWERANRTDEAIAAFRRANNVIRAEALLRKGGRSAELAELLSGEFARLSAEAGSNPPPQVTERVRSAGRRAAEAFLAVGDSGQAAELFLSLGLYGEAAACWEKGGDLLRAADLYQQGGKLEEAANLFIRAGRHELAADLFEQLHRPEKIPELLERAGKVKEAKAFAARIASEQELDPVKAGELYAQAGEYAEAARCFSEAGEWGRAGESLRSAGSPLEAAPAFEKAGRWIEAAESYAKGGKHGEAGGCFEKGGDIERARSEFERGGRFFDLGRLTEPVDVDQAIGFYQRVAASARESLAADQALARLFLEKNLLELSGQKFLKVKDKLAVDQTNLVFFYDYGRYLEASGKWKEAAGVFERILSVDFHFRDALTRKREADRRAAERKKPPAAVAETVSGGDPRTGFVMEAGAVVAGRYELLRKIGAGGMGTVFLSLDRKLGREVAVKFLPPADDGEGEQRFLREARLVAQLSHPHIVAVYDMGSVARHRYLVMEYVDGPDLGRFVRDRGPIPVAEAVSLVRQIAEALSFAHEKRIVHRDIKTANVLVGKGPTLKVADFGLARVVERERVTTTQAIGSPLYMAPELIQGKPFDHRVDLYALGIVFYELLTGSPPFTEGEVTYHQVHTPPPRPRERKGEIPVPVEAAVLKLLAKNPEDRFASAEELIPLLDVLVG